MSNFMRQRKNKHNDKHVETQDNLKDDHPTEQASLMVFRRRRRKLAPQRIQESSPRILLTLAACIALSFVFFKVYHLERGDAELQIKLPVLKGNIRETVTISTDATRLNDKHQSKQCSWLKMKHTTEQNFLEANKRLQLVPLELPPVIVHMHAHDSGGTTMSKMAKQNGLHITEFGGNPYHSRISSKHCVDMMGSIVPFMWDSDKTCRWGDYRSNDRLKWLAKVQALDHKPIQYVDEEFHSMPRWEDIYSSGQFSFITTFRDPLIRLKSQLKGEYYSKIYEKDPTFSLHDNLLKQPDNLMTRLLSSDDSLMQLSHMRVQRDRTYRAIPQEIVDMVLMPVTELHYQKARANLDKLSVILLLEHLAGMLPLMAYKFNWTNVTPIHANSRRVASNRTDWLKGVENSTSFQVALGSHTRYDKRLYNDANVLAVRQLSEAVAACRHLIRCRQYVEIMQSTVDKIQDSDGYRFALNSFVESPCTHVA